MMYHVSQLTQFKTGQCDLYGYRRVRLGFSYDVHSP